ASGTAMVCRFILLQRAIMANAAICEKWPEPAGSDALQAIASYGNSRVLGRMKCLTCFDSRAAICCAHGSVPPRRLRSGTSDDNGETLMSELPEWRLEYFEYTSSVTGDTLRKPIMTSGQCRITTLSRPGPFAHEFKYEEVWRDIKIEFEFEAIYVGQSRTIHQGSIHQEIYKDTYQSTFVAPPPSPSCILGWSSSAQ